MTPTFGQWEGPGGDVERLTPMVVRDILVDCFAATHGPRFGETRAALGLDDGAGAVKSSIQGIVRLAYSVAGGSYDAPTIEVTAKVVNLLAERSVSWGVDPDEVFEHHSHMMRLIGRAYLGCESEG